MGRELLGDELAAAVEARLATFASGTVAKRLWAADTTLWQADDAAQQTQIGGALGWLSVFTAMGQKVAELQRFAADTYAAGFRAAVLLGMGGSSLAPEVFSKVFGVAEGGLELHVLDSTDPQAVLALSESLDLDATLFIVASKSGGTTETASFEAYFFDLLSRRREAGAAAQFVAITDPDTALAARAHERGYRTIFLNPSDIGGRYSALSYFGLVPAALLGVDLERLLAGAEAMAAACGPLIPVAENPALRLGAILGEAARAGRDKLTLLSSPLVAPLGAWIEQLVAESTGKEGRGVLPVDLELLGAPGAYRNDRLFYVLRVAGELANTNELEALAALVEAGHPVLENELADPYALGGEMLRWELATAVAGSVLEINPFDQPNVQESKEYTKRLLAEYERDGQFTPDRGEPRVVYPVADAELGGALANLLASAQPGDYLALQAYVTPDDELWRQLQEVRLRLRDALALATTLGYGPRYLHSTGQYHKGGPNSGLFIQIVAHDVRDSPIAGTPFTFGVLKRAQARGDLAALQAHGRRVLRICLGDDAGAGLETLTTLIDTILAGRA